MLRKCLIFILATAVLAAPCTVSAADINSSSTEESTAGDDEDWTENEITNSFYVPKSAFHSDYDYEEYCKRMYNNGYMDEYYNWTDEALDYITNPTKEKSEALDESAKALVEERVEEGKIAPEDNPFLTYEEREAIKNSVSPTPVTDEAGTDSTEEPTTEEPEFTVTPTEEPTETITEEDVEPEETNEDTWDDTDNNFIGKFVAAAAITAIVMLLYYIYRKRNK